MGQNPSIEEERYYQRQEGTEQASEATPPYTKVSQSKPSDSPKRRSLATRLPVKGVTVVNPKPEASLRSNRPAELQKLDKIHRFWPILRSSIDTIPPQERIADGLDYKEILAMCLRYKEHLAQCSKSVAIEQRALASRLKDIEMFSAGIAQQMIRRQEKMQRDLVQLQKVNDVQTSLNQIEESLAHCVPLVQRLNNLLPEEDRLERFKLHPEPLEGDESDGGSSDRGRGEGGEAVMGEEAEERGGGGETERSVELNESERDSRTHDIEYETGPT